MTSETLTIFPSLTLILRPRGPTVRYKHSASLILNIILNCVQISYRALKFQYKIFSTKQGYKLWGPYKTNGSYTIWALGFTLWANSALILSNGSACICRLSLSEGQFAIVYVPFCQAKANVKRNVVVNKFAARRPLAGCNCETARQISGNDNARTVP